MYGYVLPDKDKIKQEEFVLYSAFYCGMCKCIGNRFSQALRYTTNYDIAFFAALVFDQLNANVEFDHSRCVGNPFNQKPTIRQNELMDRIADINIILAYHKILDNLLDGKRGAKTAARFVKKHYLQAAKREPRADSVCQNAFKELQEIEARGEASIDIAAHCFAGQLKDLAQIFLDENENALSLCYNVGKFVYLADALDDVDEDAKRGAYNPFLAANGGEFAFREQFIKQNLNSISFALVSTVNRAIESFNGIKFNQSYGLLENIIYYGLRKKTDELLNSKKKLKRPKL